MAASLRTVVQSPVASQATCFHPSRQSTVRFDSLCSGLFRTRINQKNCNFSKIVSSLNNDISLIYKEVLLILFNTTWFSFKLDDFYLSLTKYILFLNNSEIQSHKSGVFFLQKCLFLPFFSNCGQHFISFKMVQPKWKKIFANFVEFLTISFIYILEKYRRRLLRN